MISLKEQSEVIRKAKELILQDQEIILALLEASKGINTVLKLWRKEQGWSDNSIPAFRHDQLQAAIAKAEAK